MALRTLLHKQMERRRVVCPPNHDFQLAAVAIGRPSGAGQRELTLASLAHVTARPQRGAEGRSSHLIIDLQPFDCELERARPSSGANYGR